MSEFSDLLTQHIHSKDIKTYALAQYCGLDRSNMYKIINGKRKPSSADIVEKMAKFMQLSPTEEKDLEEAYQITLAGSGNYYRRKEVMKFFSDFRLPTSVFSSFNYNIEETNTEEVLLLDSLVEVKQALLHMIALERNKKNGHICLLIQPDCDFLMDILNMPGPSDEYTRIDHIIYLNNASETTLSRKNYNLSCLKQILPLYGSHCNYECFYYYDSVSSKTGTFTLLPYMVITSQSVCFLTSSLDKGYITHSEDSLLMFRKIFSGYLEECSPLLKRIYNVSDQLTYVGSLQAGCTTGFSLQMPPCITPFITLSLLEKYILLDMPERDIFLENMQEYIRSHGLRKDSISYIFSFPGVIRFLNSGRIGEYPTDIYSPFELRDRIHLIKRLVLACQTLNYRMMKHDIGNPEHELYLFVSQQKGYLMFSVPETTQMIYLNIEEPGLLFTFLDFCKNLDNDLFYTKEETVSLLNKLIQKARK